MVKVIQILAVSLMLVCASGAARADDYEDGEAAADRGDYVTALKLLSPLAQEGLAGAQAYIGSMYEQGHGVAQNYKEAVKWYRLAAKQGDASAQQLLAFMYEQGRGVAPHYIRAHMWFNLAAASLSGDEGKRAASGRELVSKSMFSDEIAQAQEMARKCQESNYKHCD